MTSPDRRLALTSLALLLALPVAAQQRALFGKVLDGTGAPVAEATVDLTSPDSGGFHRKASTNKKGEFTVVIALPTLRSLTARIEREGFETSESTFDAPGAGTFRMEFRLVSDAERKAREDAVRAVESAKRAAAATVAFDAGVVAAQARDWKAAAERFEEALALKEDSWETHANLATAAMNLEDPSRAERHARRALEFNPASAEMQRLLAQALEDQGRAAEAEAALAKVAEIDPKTKALLAFNRGADLANQKKTAEAIAAFDEAVAADPGLAEAHYALGITALGVGDSDKARTHLARYLELAPDGKHAATAGAALKAVAPGKK